MEKEYKIIKNLTKNINLNINQGFIIYKFAFVKFSNKYFRIFYDRYCETCKTHGFINYSFNIYYSINLNLSFDIHTYKYIFLQFYTNFKFFGYVSHKL